jgi:hypothetical protein
VRFSGCWCRGSQGLQWLRRRLGFTAADLIAVWLKHLGTGSYPLTQTLGPFCRRDLRAAIANLSSRYRINLRILSIG